MATSVPSAAELQVRLEKLVVERQVVGATLAVLADGEITEAAAGLVNHATGVETTTDSIFQIGSISKPWATTLAMQLVEEGLLELDAPIVRYLPDLDLGEPGRAAKVTVQMLLNHTSGIGGDWFVDTGRGDDCLEKYVATLGSVGFGAEPGERFSYCNSGWTILGRILEVTTGEPWDAALRRRLIHPLGLNHCVTLPEEAILHRAAVGHFLLPGQDVTVAPIWALPRSTGPAGATLTMTPRDLLGFGRLHLDGGVAPDGTRLLSTEHVARMQQQTVDLRELDFFPGLAGWGLGWMLFDWGGTRVIGHDGGTGGQVATLRIAPERGIAVAAMANTVPQGAVLLRDVAQWVWGEVFGIIVPADREPPSDPPAFDAERYVGTYERPGLTTKVEVAADGGLTIEHIPGPDLAAFVPQTPPTPLVAYQHDKFLTTTPGVDVWSPVVFLGDESITHLFDGGRLARRT